MVSEQQTHVDNAKNNAKNNAKDNAKERVCPTVKVAM
jgi:hypothetical protein